MAWNFGHIWFVFCTKMWLCRKFTAVYIRIDLTWNNPQIPYFSKAKGRDKLNGKLLSSINPWQIHGFEEGFQFQHDDYLFKQWQKERWRIIWVDKRSADRQINNLEEKTENWCYVNLWKYMCSLYTAGNKTYTCYSNHIHNHHRNSKIAEYI